ncbi:hypothetical protein AV521_12580 [Streptomyces sp. IMTB 2501]|nr:hypothetical protein AV521_12580 [Streptomyces sp. IMTB 2501]
MYLPQAASAPAYDGYTDPAAAHGWTSAYDETRELPSLIEPSEPHRAAEPNGVNEPPGRSLPGEGRAARRRAGRRTGGRRRLAAVAGALGLAGAVAVIAAVAGGSPTSKGSGPAVADSATPSPRATAGSPAAVTDAPSAVPSRSSASPAVRMARARETGGPTATASAPPPATSSAPAPTFSPGFPGVRGRGHGAAKHHH